MVGVNLPNIPNEPSPYVSRQTTIESPFIMQQTSPFNQQQWMIIGIGALAVIGILGYFIGTSSKKEGN